MSRKKRTRQRTSTATGPAAAAGEIGRRGKWTAAGAARAARDARIATAAHMRSAEVARRWEAGKLISGTQVWQAHITTQVQQLGHRATETQVREIANHMILGGAGLTRPYPTGLADAAQAILDRRSDDLDAATLYVLSPSMCDVVIAAAQTLTLDDLALLTAADLPSPTGMVMLPFPLIIRATSGDLGDDRAYVWHAPTQLHLGPPDSGTPAAPLARVVRRVLADRARPDGPQVLDAVRVTSYMDSHGPVRPDSFRDMATHAAQAGTPLPPLLADSTRTHAFEPNITEAARIAMTSLQTTAREHGDQWRQRNADLGFDESDNVTDTQGFTYHPGDEIDDTDDTFSLRFLYAFWRLCGQQIAQLTDQPANHSAQLQAARAGVSPEVRVVTIRPHRRTDDEAAHAGRDWQHRWVVRMHKVRQWYPSEQRHKILYRGPYIKGPADKPLLGGEIVRSMSGGAPRKE